MNDACISINNFKKKKKRMEKMPQAVPLYFHFVVMSLESTDCAAIDPLPGTHKPTIITSDRCPYNFWATTEEIIINQ